MKSQCHFLKLKSNINFNTLTTTCFTEGQQEMQAQAIKMQRDQMGAVINFFSPLKFQKIKIVF